jgi:hypothetical protein
MIARRSRRDDDPPVMTTTLGSAFMLMSSPTGATTCTSVGGVFPLLRQRALLLAPLCQPDAEFVEDDHGDQQGDQGGDTSRVAVTAATIVITK